MNNCPLYNSRRKKYDDEDETDSEEEDETDSEEEDETDSEDMYTKESFKLFENYNHTKILYGVLILLLIAFIGGAFYMMRKK